jgi:hypothetical protein
MRPTDKRLQLAGVAFFLFLVIVQEGFGFAAGVRALGVSLFVAALILSFKQSITLATIEFTGWIKAFILLPLFMIGALAALYPNAFACAAYLRGRTCP